MIAIISFEDHVGEYKTVTRPVEEEAEIAMAFEHQLDIADFGTKILSRALVMFRVPLNEVKTFNGLKQITLSNSAMAGQAVEF
jgi:hypothetical protein